MAVIDRTMRILEAISSADEPMSLTMLADAVELPLTTTHRIVHALIDSGAIERAEGGTLHVGWRLWELGMRSPSVVALHVASNLHLHELHEATGAQVAVLRFESADVMVVDRIGGEGLARRPSLGARVIAAAYDELRQARQPDAVLRISRGSDGIELVSRLPRTPEVAVSLLAPDAASAQTHEPALLVTARRIDAGLGIDAGWGRPA